MKKNLRLLHIEDSEDDAYIIHRELRKGGYDLYVERVETAEEMLAALQKQEWDLIITDSSLPSFSGKEAVSLFEKDQTKAPLIFVSGSIDEGIAITALQYGAMDYVMKQDLTRLLPSVNRALEEAEALRKKREAEVAKRVADERYRSTLDNMLEGAQIISFDWRYLYINRAAEKHNRRASTDLIGRTYQESWPGIESTEVYRVLRRCMEERKPQQMENQFVFSDGSMAWFEMNVQPVSEGIFILSQDISERKRAEQELMRIGNQLGMILNSAGEGIYGVDMNGVITFINPKALKMLGYREDELIGQSAHNLLHHHHADGRLNKQEDCLFYAAVHAGKNFHIEDAIFWRKDGSNFPISYTSNPVYDHDNILSGSVVVFSDITERKQSEEARIAREIADRANRAKSEFLSQMSHELRTPLNSILGFAQLMELDELPPRLEKNVKQILTAGKHLLELINEVLDIGRIDAGKISLLPEPVKLHSLIVETMSTVSPLVEDHHLTMEFVDSPNNQLSVIADRQRLKQVLLNLVSNAIKFNRKKGKVSIAVTLTNTPNLESIPSASGKRKTKSNKDQLQESNAFPPATVHISVADTGLGIPLEFQPRIFSPFERGGAGLIGVEGTGLGLSISKKLVEAMGGTIGFESVPDQGSTFWIELPQTTSSLDNATATNTLVKVGAVETIKGTILYVEDNHSNLQLVEQILKERPGVNLITTLRGQLAHELAEQHAPDLILLDLNLPDISGAEVLKRLCANPKTSAIPVVVVSADATSAHIEALIKDGAQGYLTKPFNVIRFLELIDEMLEK